MKKILKILLVMILFVVTGCSSSEKETTTTKETITNNDSKVLVLYFSATNNTKGIADKIANITNGELEEIQPKEEYTSDDLDYNDDNSRANKEMNDDSARPEISNTINIDGYDTIYIGYPIWWGTNPRIILTLLDTYDFSNKNVALFCTSGSSDISKSASDLAKYNSKMNILGSKRFSSQASDSEIEEWINELNK